MKLKCKVCGNYHEKYSPPMRDFRLLAYGGMIEWSDFTEKSHLPPLHAQHWERREKTPVIGKKIIVKACAPFDFEIGGEFWHLFQPAYSHFNGWDEYPEEIEKSAIVKCRFVRSFNHDEYSGWIEVEIVDVILLGDIEKHFSDTTVTEEYDIIHASHTATEWGIDYQNWIYKGVSIQGDYNEWAMYHIDGQGRKHLLLFGQSGFHDDFVFVGNIL